MAQCSRVLEAPAPDVILVSFDASAINYRARFWVDDYERDEGARDQVRTAIYYAFGRRGIDIPWPIQVQYEREWPEADARTRQRDRESMIAGVDLFSSLTQEQRAAIAAATTTKVFGDAETIVRQDDPGHSMYVVCSGRASVVLEPQRTEVAVIERGGYFGEMSLLTGEPRTATVLAQGDVIVLELDSDVFRKFGADNPAAVEQIAVAAMTRREELDQVRAAARGSAVAEAPATFISRMKRFLGLT
jgi:CRP-like cAMP-binding protein